MRWRRRRYRQTAMRVGFLEKIALMVSGAMSYNVAYDGSGKGGQNHLTALLVKGSPGRAILGIEKGARGKE